MDYRLPTAEDEELLKEYIVEHYAHGERSISASHGLPVSEYSEWVRTIENNALQGSEEWGKSLLYLCFKGERLIGLLSIRYELPEALSKQFGDIGYGVRPSERGKGYASEMLRHALLLCREKGKREIIVGCYKDNAASAAVIEKCGGSLFAENDNYKAGKLSTYYSFVL